MAAVHQSGDDVVVSVLFLCGRTSLAAANSYLLAALQCYPRELCILGKNFPRFVTFVSFCSNSLVAASAALRLLRLGVITLRHGCGSRHRAFTGAARGLVNCQ
jgi:hypothetical protein